MAAPSAKRHMANTLPDVLRRDEALFQTDADDPWVHASLYAIIPSSSASGSSPSSTDERGAKRSYEPDDWTPDLERTPVQHPDESPSDALVDLFPSLFPSLPPHEVRHVAKAVTHPFTEVSKSRHTGLRDPASVPKDNTVNGYVKFRLIHNENSSPTHQEKSPIDRPMLFASRSRQPSVMGSPITGLPPGFGKNFKLDALDNKLMKFYIVAICAGRTLLPKTNGWLVDLAPMAEGDECVQHALLALAAGYALDYGPSEKLRQRANLHYRIASDLLSKKLADPSIHEVGKEDAAVGALRILWCDDIVQWELRRSKGQEPRWYDAAQAAKGIMANTDPGYRYWHAVNVQCTSARISNANMLAFVDILSLPVTPLNPRDTERCHPWLLEGTERESRRIYGGTGICPKLLHMLGQITHLAGRMAENPDSTIIPLGAHAVERRLMSLRQWSELSEGYPSAEALFKDCVLDDQGYVDSRAKVTELAAEAWVQAARIYLQCRFFRMPRSHRAVQEPLSILMRCIKMMPCSGPLFTSQSPFFPTFVMGLVSVDAVDRQTVRNWFTEVISRAGARSSVPPVWRVLQDTWEWMDDTLVDDPLVDQKSIGERVPWWELLVEWLVNREGRLSLA